MSYEYGIKKINERYDNVIEDIKDVSNKYDKSINELKKIQGVDECIKLKSEIENKKNRLNEKVLEIRRIKESLLQSARYLDRKEREAQIAQQMAQQQVNQEIEQQEK